MKYFIQFGSRSSYDVSFPYKFNDINPSTRGYDIIGPPGHPTLCICKDTRWDSKARLRGLPGRPDRGRLDWLAQAETLKR